jgi:predicted phosphodiesterase
MKLFAVSDLHLHYPVNRDALAALPAHPGDWFIVAGDVGEGEADLHFVFDQLAPRFDRLFWVPGNHELWTHPRTASTLRGVEKYEACVRVCREHGVLTPEDPFVRWEGPGGPAWIVPLFLLYDYSFAPDGMDPEAAIAWAREAGVVCLDERFLHADPHADKVAWCRDRVASTLARLEQLDRSIPWVLVNHFPMRGDLTRLPAIPRFRIWCGTTETEDWHRRFPVSVVVSGHLHMPATDWRDGVRFEEVSLGYPSHWNVALGIEAHLREILPGPSERVAGDAPTVWRRLKRWSD